MERTLKDYEERIPDVYSRDIIDEMRADGLKYAKELLKPSNGYGNNFDIKATIDNIHHRYKFVPQSTYDHTEFKTLRFIIEYFNLTEDDFSL